MELDEYSLSYAVGSVYVVAPPVLLYLMVYRPGTRSVCASILGAITPISIAYLYAIVAANSDRQEGLMPYGAMLVMTFGLYLASLIAGLLIGLVKVPRNLIARYFAAAASVYFIEYAVRTLK